MDWALQCQEKFEVRIIIQMINVILSFYLPTGNPIMRVVGTASRKASLSATFCSYSDFILIPLSGFLYNDLMTLRAA